MALPQVNYQEMLYLKGIKLYYSNGKYLGDVIQDVDGCYLYFPKTDRGGGWTSSALLAIGVMLYEMNKPLEDELEAFFGSGNQDGVDHSTTIGFD